MMIFFYWIINNTGKGSNPEWNETFLFTIAGNTPEIIIKIMDSDSGSADDFVGEAMYYFRFCRILSTFVREK